MLSAQEACAIVLGRCEGRIRDGKPERFAIQYCELSDCGEYWVVRCNSEDYVVHGMTEYCYVGVNAHLVHATTGAVETVASCFTVDEYLQDKTDLAAAAGNVYVLVPAFTREDKPALINLRRKLACSYPQAIAMLSSDARQWLTGKRRLLEDARHQLAMQGIATAIELQSCTNGAVMIGPGEWHISGVFRAIDSRLRQLPGSVVL